MAITLATAVRNAACDAVVDLFDDLGPEGVIHIRSGTRPTSANDPATGDLLVQLSMASPAFGAATTGTASLLGTPLEEVGLVSGTATWFRALDAGSNVIFDGDVDTSGADLIVNTTTVTVGVAFRITAGTVTMPSGE